VFESQALSSPNLLSVFIFLDPQLANNKFVDFEAANACPADRQSANGQSPNRDRADGQGSDGNRPGRLDADRQPADASFRSG
jgi:hypothetical protein